MNVTLNNEGAQENNSSIQERLISLTLEPSHNTQLHKNIHSIVISTVQKIAQDYEARLQGYKKNVSCLDGGIWMPNAYFKALKEKNQITRLRKMVSKNYFYHFYSKDFEAIPSADAIHKTGFVKCQIRIKKGVSPSEALKSAQRGPTLVDCATVCQLGQYQALLEVLGEEKFNYLFGHETGSPLVLCSYAIDNPLMPFLTKYIIKNSEKCPINEVKLEKGWRVVFNNVSKYNIKHGMRGDAVSFDVICLDPTPGQEKFIGLGLKSEGITEKELEQVLIEEYNTKPIDLEAVSDELANKLFSGGKPVFKIRCDLSDSQNPLPDEDYKKQMAIYRPDLSEKIVEKNIVYLKELREPLTMESAADDSEFGFDPNSRLDFDMDLIQRLEEMTIQNIKAITKKIFKD
ncbi:hypothetical protein [Candidatus Protochlamydia amoebophila]|uniref:Uncharacterized protein n=1 Tax=Protochlamydia amoebophila (strain UWE25) TaxID=264201 RepID=Q6MET1_PARUW|nr:hypothetical protein [Candidatus Protochlamydia amoebophila]CAF22918.1 unnamed protein product [Candidatus Protochlamydia amoebophila UWE25]